MGKKTDWHERDSFSAVRPLSDRVAAWFDWTTPNMVTLAGLLLAIPMIFCFASGHVVAGAILFALGGATDFVDGALARYQDAKMGDAGRAAEKRRHWLVQRGQTGPLTVGGRQILTGASFDPLIDKLRYFGALFPLGWGPLWAPLIVAGAVFAAALTYLRGKYPDAKANRWGKFKAWAELALIALLILLPRHGAWIAPAQILLVAATLLGGMSLLGQIMTLLKNRKAAP